MIPSIEHPTGQANFTIVVANRVRYWFSYSTCVAFQAMGHTYVRKNVWGTTTGKHLNAIDGGDRQAKEKRLDQADFFDALELVYDLIAIDWENNN